MRKKLENSLIFNNHFIVGVYEKWEEEYEMKKYAEGLSKTEKTILYLFWEKIVYEKYKDHDFNREIHVLFNNILRIMLMNIGFKKSIFDRVVHLVNIKEIDNNFDFMENLNKEFDDILTYLEDKYEIHKLKAASMKSETRVSGFETDDQDLSYGFSQIITYPK